MGKKYKRAEVDTELCRFFVTDVHIIGLTAKCAGLLETGKYVFIVISLPGQDKGWQNHGTAMKKTVKGTPRYNMFRVKTDDCMPDSLRTKVPVINQT